MLSLFITSMAVFSLTVALYRRYTVYRRQLRLPPGPKGIPIFGNIYNMPKSFEWLAYDKWSRQYDSDLIYLNFSGTPVVVVHSLQAATDLFEKRSALYSDRPSATMLTELLGFKFNIAFMPYGDQWRDTRRAFHQHIKESSTSLYRPRLTKEAQGLLLRLFQEPDSFMKHIRHMAGSLIMRITYGIDVQATDDPYITTAESALQSIAKAGNPGAYLVDYITALKYVPAWMPGADFKRQAAQWRKHAMAMLQRPFATVDEALTRGSVTPCIATSMLSRLDDDENKVYMKNIYRNAAASAYVAGSDTTVSSVQSFILAMLLYPEVQKKARQELDRIVGKGRLPEFADKASLPYISAVVMEVLRWHPVTPLGVPHRLTTDDEYMGYDLPAGTIVMGNSWAILHDEKTYPQPNRFWPERFLSEDGTLNADVPDPMQAAFGFGRRICPGRHLAVDSVWITVASVLSVFEVTAPLDELGNPIRSNEEYTTGLLSYPVPFKCAFKPRTSEAESLVRLCINNWSE